MLPWLFPLKVVEFFFGRARVNINYQFFEGSFAIIINNTYRPTLLRFMIKWRIVACTKI